MNQTALKVIKNQKDTKNELELSVEAPQDVASKAYFLAYKGISEELDIPGFRKGKAPVEIVEKTVGKGQISRKAFERIFYDVLLQAVEQEGLDVLEVKEVSSFELLPEKPLTFKVNVELKPEVKLGKYKKLKIKAKKIVYDKEIFIKKTLDRIVNNMFSFKPVIGRAVRQGDYVVIDFDGKFEDGTEIPGGKAENFHALLEKDKFLPEFVDKLVGAKINDERTIEITFPNTETPYAGKKGYFKVKINKIEEKELPEINDDLAKKVGLANLEELKQKIESEMIKLQDQNSKNELENKLVEKIIESSEFEVPEKMIEKEIDFLLQDIKEECIKKGHSWDSFKSDEKNKDLIAKAKETALKRISIDLVLNAVVKKEAIKVPQDDVNEETNKRVSQLGEKYKHLLNDARFKKAVELNLIRNKAIDFLLENNQADWEVEITKIIPD